MEAYLIAAAVIFLVNVVPAFAPPTWTVLVFISLQYNVHAFPLIVIGIISATTGRYILASVFRSIREKLPQGWVTNMENAGTHLTKSQGHTWALFLLFFLSPLSSAQLFEAAGVMKSVPLKPLAFAFAGGRVITYTTYVTGAHALKATSFGEIISKNLTSPSAIALQIAMVVGLVMLGNVKWKPHQPQVSQ